MNPRPSRLEGLVRTRYRHMASAEFITKLTCTTELLKLAALLRLHVINNNNVSIENITK